MKLKEARAFISAIVAMREGATDEQALAAVALYPEWREGAEYIGAGADKPQSRVKRGGTLYKCAQGHRSQAGWEPENAPALWVSISLKAGTTEDPIDALRGMEYEEGKHYLDPEDGKIYLCTRGGVLQYLPHELVGHYFTVN